MSGSFDGRKFASRLTSAPGVYRMLGGGGKVLYVGKAHNLKKRVGSYFTRAIRPPTVPAGTSRLRITLSAAHSEEQVDRLLDTLGACWQPT